MWVITTWSRGTLLERRFDLHDEIGMSGFWVTVKHRARAACRRVDPDTGHILGTRRHADPLSSPHATRILCGDCDKEAWSTDPNNVLCIACEISIRPNDPTPHGQDCVLSRDGYHEWTAPDAAGVERCRQCCAHK